MKPSTIFYNIGQGFKGVFRHRVMTTASMLILIACMILVGTFYLVIDTIDRNFQAIDNLNVIEIMLDKDYEKEEVIEIGEQLAVICNGTQIIDWTSDQWLSEQEFPQSDNFKYVSADEHLEIMREQYKDEDWFDGMFGDHSHDEGEDDGTGNTVADNPLRASYRITFVNLSDFDEVTRVKNQIDEIVFVNENGEKTDAVKTEDIKDNIELYGNVMNIKETLYIAGIWLMGIFLLIALFVIMNTIKLGVSARENEITFMRLCGATKNFIRMPFIVEGIIIGVFSAIVSFGIEFYLFEYLLKDIISSTAGTAGAGSIIAASFSEYAPFLGIGFLGIGLFAGVVASSISMKKYLSA